MVMTLWPELSSSTHQHRQCIVVTSTFKTESLLRVWRQDAKKVLDPITSDSEMTLPYIWYERVTMKTSGCLDTTYSLLLFPVNESTVEEYFGTNDEIEMISRFRIFLGELTTCGFTNIDLLLFKMCVVTSRMQSFWVYLGRLKLSGFR